jgi:hypothetical protein
MRVVITALFVKMRGTTMALDEIFKDMDDLVNDMNKLIERTKQ